MPALHPKGAFLIITLPSSAVAHSIVCNLNLSPSPTATPRARFMHSKPSPSSYQTPVERLACPNVIGIVGSSSYPRLGLPSTVKARKIDATTLAVLSDAGFLWEDRQQVDTLSLEPHTPRHCCDLHAGAKQRSHTHTDSCPTIAAAQGANESSSQQLHESHRPSTDAFL